MDLESEILKKKTEYEVLEAKYRALEAEKLGIEQQLEDLRRENGELKECIRGGENKEGLWGAKRTERVVDLSEHDSDEDRFSQLMIENKMLECEKKKAERDVEAWKSKFRELEVWLGRGLGSASEQRPLVEKSMGNKDKVVDLVDVGVICCSPAKGTGTPKAAGSASNYTPCKHGDCIKEEVNHDCVDLDADYAASLQARRRLAFEKEKSPGKKIAPSTPAGAKPPYLSIVDIFDSDDEPNDARGQLPTQNEGSLKTVNPLKRALGKADSSKKVIATKASLKGTNSQEDNEEDVDACKEKIPLVSTRKRKRASNIVMSDSESDSDDNIPIGRLKKMNLEEKGYKQIGSSENTIASVGNGKGSASPPRRRLATLRKCRGKVAAERESPHTTETKESPHTTETKYRQGIPTNVSTEDEESDETGSESEGESLGGFIVNDSDVSGGDNASSESEDHVDEKTDFNEILSNLQRKKERKFMWDFEADMLADFGKDTELCMKAVCALYRQQTSEEKISKGTLYTNCRGFNKFDAFRGTNLAEFLIAGDPQGDLQKTVQELEQHDPKAIKLCRSLATRYSKQLFEIYKNKEDPLFLP